MTHYKTFLWEIPILDSLDGVVNDFIPEDLVATSRVNPYF